MIYLDTSAAMKLVRPELHSHDLSRWFRERRGEPVVSSILLEVELMRATRRVAPEQVPRAVAVLQSVGVLAISVPVVERAGGYEHQELRSLDAVHLATAEHAVAVSRQELTGFVAYDVRLLAAARSIGLTVEAPGLS